MPDDRICGLNAVTALFARRPDDVVRLFYDEDHKTSAGPLCAELARVRRPYRLLPPDEMEKAAGNPHNLGAIARSAAFFGVGALLLHETPLQAMPSDAAYRVAEGGLEHLAVYKTRNLRKALLALDPHYRTVAATLTADAVPLSTLPRDRPVALVLGNEERGVGFEALETCRRRVRIDGRGAVQSLNVAQAAAVLLHDLTRQAA